MVLKFISEFLDVFPEVIVFLCEFLKVIAEYE